MSTVPAERQKLNPSAPIELFALDLNPIGVVEVLYFCRDFGVVFGGVAYTQAPVKVEGIERSTSGENATPKLSLPNTTKFASSLVLQYQDLVGAELTRTTTYAKYLDGQPTADPAAIEELDVFVVEQKTNMNKTYGEWELRVLGDTADRTLPGRSADRDVCAWVYRTWNPTLAAFVPSKVKPCPYTNTTYMFDQDNNAVTDPSQDKCDNIVNGGCTARTPGWPGGVLGFGGFPGMSRYRTS